jgi:hypothetical protein
MVYAAAKVFELNDHEIYHWTGQLVSGHTLKHLVAALAAWPVIAAIFALRHTGEYPAGGIRGLPARNAEEA